MTTSSVHAATIAIGLLGAAATLAVIGIVLLEQARFRFDPATRLIEWDQRWAFRRRAGIAPFSGVNHVSVQVRSATEAFRAGAWCFTWPTAHCCR